MRNGLPIEMKIVFKSKYATAFKTYKKGTSREEVVKIVDEIGNMLVEAIAINKSKWYKKDLGIFFNENISWSNRIYSSYTLRSNAKIEGIRFSKNPKTITWNIQIKYQDGVIFEGEINLQTGFKNIAFLKATNNNVVWNKTTNVKLLDIKNDGTSNDKWNKLNNLIGTMDSRYVKIIYKDQYIKMSTIKFWQILTDIDLRVFQFNTSSLKLEPVINNFKNTDIEKILKNWFQR